MSSKASMATYEVLGQPELHSEILSQKTEDWGCSQVAENLPRSVPHNKK
jgi:hypothetical protein